MDSRVSLIPSNSRLENDRMAKGGEWGRETIVLGPSL
jgi:hypothetical protein